MIVADTNLIVYLVVESERTAAAEAAFARDPDWALPLLWRSEFRNALVRFIRRGDLALPDALRMVDRAERRMRGREFQVASAPVLAFAAASGCSAYDCEYVALAQELGVRLVTEDRQVLAAFPSTAVGLDDFIA